MGPEAGARVALADLAQERERVDPGFVPVRPREPEGVRADPADLARMDVVRHLRRIEPPFARPLVHAMRARAPLAQRPVGVPAPVAVVPENPEMAGGILGDVLGNRPTRHRLAPSRPRGKSRGTFRSFSLRERARSAGNFSASPEEHWLSEPNAAGRLPDHNPGGCR